MGMFDLQMESILGYSTSEYGAIALAQGSYLSVRTDEEINPFLTDLIDMVTTLSDTIYPNADISDYVETLQNGTFGPVIRKAIYDIFKELSRVSHIYIGRELAAIRLSHFGRDMRKPIYDALTKLGINNDLYYQATSSDFLYTISNNIAILDHYIGDIHPYMKLPDKVEDTNNPGYMVDVDILSATLFNNNEWIKDVVIPSTVSQIL